MGRNLGDLFLWFIDLDTKQAPLMVCPILDCVNPHLCLEGLATLGTVWGPIRGTLQCHNCVINTPYPPPFHRGIPVILNSLIHVVWSDRVLFFLFLVLLFEFYTRCSLINSNCSLPLPSMPKRTFNSDSLLQREEATLPSSFSLPPLKSFSILEASKNSPWSKRAAGKII